MPIITVLGIGNQIALPELYEQFVACLRNHSHLALFSYPIELRSSKSTDSAWFAASKTIRQLNEESILGKLRDGVNCYAIHTKERDCDWRLRYIGQTECRLARSIIASQLAATGPRRGFVFAKCRDAVRAGSDIGLSLFKVEPDIARFFIQEKAIANLGSLGELDWNARGAT